MRNPNGYGSVVYLGKNRRKPYAVRVTNGYKEVNGRFRQQYKYLGYFEKSKEANMFLANYNSGMPVKPYAVRVTNGYKEVNGRFRQQYKYLGYFEKSKEANMFLANYNSGMPVKEHTSLIKEPTFKEVYESWLEYKKSRKKPPTASTIRNYNLAYNRFSDVKDRKIKNIQTDDIQKIADKVSEKSNSTMVLTKTVLSQVYEYAMKRKYVDINIADLCDWDYTETKEKMHKPFTEDEIKML